MTDTIPPRTSGVSCTTTSSSGVCFDHKMNMNKTMLHPLAVSFMTKKANQDKTPSISDVITLQFGQSVTHIDPKGFCVPEIITKVKIFTITGYSIYLIEGTLIQYHQAKTDSLHVSLDTNIFFINNTIHSIRTNTDPKKTLKHIGCVPHCHIPDTTNFYPASPIDQRLQSQF